MTIRDNKYGYMRDIGTFQHICDIIRWYTVVHVTATVGSEHLLFIRGRRVAGVEGEGGRRHVN